jgi:RND family efflux transporter MFP subunit
MPVMFRALIILAISFASIDASAQAPVRVATVSDSSIVRQVHANGTVTSPRSALLSTAVAGIVADLMVDEGHAVNSGDPLLILDAELAQLALERARAEVRQREVALEDAKRRFAEAEKVGTQQSIARTTIESLRSEVTSDEAALAASRAAAREQQAIVERHTLRAPFAGVVSRRMTEVGEWVNPGNGLLELVAIDNLRFDFRVGQDSFALLTPETPVEITLDAIPGRTLNGRVDKIVPVKNPGARTFLVRVLAEADPSLRITPGMSARGKLSIDTGDRGIAVPRDAILRFPDGRITVWVVKDSGDTAQVHERIVQTGLEFDGFVEVLDGVSAGERVVVRGNETLQEGQEVSVLNGGL